MKPFIANRHGYEHDSLDYALDLSYALGLPYGTVLSAMRSPDRRQWCAYVAAYRAMGEDVPVSSPALVSRSEVLAALPAPEEAEWEPHGPGPLVAAGRAILIGLALVGLFAIAAGVAYLRGWWVH
jgi:hypothetical protein